MKKILFSLILAGTLLFAFTGTGFSIGKTITVLPFFDDSAYRGPWKIDRGVAEMLGDMLTDNYFYTVPMDSVLSTMPAPPKKGLFSKIIKIFSDPKPKSKLYTDGEMLVIARKLNADYVITGIIDDYTYKRSGVGDALIGGYKSYVAKVKVSNVRVIRVADSKNLGIAKGEASKDEKGLGLELFGKPRKRDMEFYSLDSLDFGSKRFLGTLMGTATVEALNKVQKTVRAMIAAPDTSWFAQKKFKILSIEAGIAHINAGSMDGVKPGDKFLVYAADTGVLVGKLNVTNLWSDHMSNADIIDGKDAVRPNDYIMPER